MPKYLWEMIALAIATAVTCATIADTALVNRDWSLAWKIIAAVPVALFFFFLIRHRFVHKTTSSHHT